MTTLNQAFIKAYQRRGIAGPHIPLPESANVVAETPTAAPATPTALRPQPEFRQSDAVPAASVREIDATPPAAPAIVFSRHGGVARIDEPTPAFAATKPAAVAHESESYEKPREEVVPVADELPKSDEIAAPEAAEDDDLRPAYEVERFEWPSVVRPLLDRTSAELSSLVGELLPDGRGSLLVTGCRRGEGRTSIALLLARHLAQKGARVLLIDADFQRPQVASSLATHVEIGWEEMMSGAAVSDALIESLADRLVILPLRRPVAAKVLSKARTNLRTTLARLQGAFDVILADAGPLIEAGASGHETLFGAAPWEAAVVVRDVRHCRLEQSHAVGHQLVQLGARRWAIIENFV
ncbi:MAG TPA: AAA family ATPase [Pirellulales bacterium]|nr:AAA family ATPase [Pirellulales bacterium]